jgi:hypothetical protein
MLKDYQTKLISLYIEQELSLAQLYLLFSEQQPEHEDLWAPLYHEELEHASWIEYLAVKAAAGTLQFHEDRTKTYTVEALLNYLKELIDLAHTEPIPARRALALAMDLEKSLIESKVFEHFTPDPTEQATMIQLREKTQDHMARLRTVWIQSNSLVPSLRP